MLRIAIAGNIASGKSETENFLISKGFRVLDTDKIAHDLLKNNQAVLDAFKEYDITENGKISRSKLGKLVFSNMKLKKLLEDILYPEIIIKINTFFETCHEEKLAFVSIPQIFEAGMEHLFDKIIFIYADDNIRLKRLIARNNYTKEYAICRINAQQKQKDKVEKADYVIYNNSNLENLHNQIIELLASLDF